MIHKRFWFVGAIRRIAPTWVIIIILFIIPVHAQDTNPVIETVDGVEMVQVPAGCFMMGSDDGYPNEAPAHEICFDTPFWIDRYEMSNAQVNTLDFAPERAPSLDGDDLPRTNIMWIEAQAVCAERGGRLPTESEWAYAARGPDSPIYPWGDNFDDNRANLCDVNCPLPWGDSAIDDGYPEVGPVTAFEDGASWVGAVNMSGNVWEWTSTAYDTQQFPYPYDADDGREAEHVDPRTVVGLRVIRGGAWDDTTDGVRASVRTARMNYYDTDANIGFRCVRDIIAP
jgi:formylglycine-generating enzyme required for sulfatase activity